MNDLMKDLHIVYMAELLKAGDCKHRGNFEDLPETIKLRFKALAEYVLNNYERKHNAQ